MKHKLVLLSLAFFGFLFLGNVDIKAQYSPTPLFIDDVIHVKQRSPKVINYSQIQKNMKKNKPKVNRLSRFECQGYNNYKSNVKGKREKMVFRSRKQHMKKVLASR